MVKALFLQNPVSGSATCKLLVFFVWSNFQKSHIPETRMLHFSSVPPGCTEVLHLTQKTYAKQCLHTILSNKNFLVRNLDLDKLTRLTSAGSWCYNCAKILSIHSKKLLLQLDASLLQRNIIPSQNSSAFASFSLISSICFHSPPHVITRSPLSPLIWQFKDAGGGGYVTPVTSITLIAASCPVLTWRPCKTKRRSLFILLVYLAVFCLQ